MPFNEPNPASDPLGPTEPGEHDISDPVAQLLERTRGDELDFDGEFEEQRLLQKLFDLQPQETRIGRFVVRERLGAGGMGEVYRARDTRLDCDVALKLLRTNVQHENSSILIDEAKALAKVKHDNVVHVYDVDIHEGRPYYTMEVIEGQTLAEWVKQRPALPAIIELFVRAGRGLQAIHAAGLVHGDFKPRNVLVGKDGRVRVADFGLATTIGTSSGLGPEDVDLRRPAGTLGYLAPELFEGAPPSVASDQFSFCAALFEAVYGTLPFPRRTQEELHESIERGILQFPSTRGRKAPRWMRRLLDRGLARDRGSRYPDMGVLLEELGRDRAALRRRWFSAAAVLALAGALGWAWSRVPKEEPLTSGWDDVQQQKLVDAFAAIDDEPWAAGSRDTVIANLERWSSTWTRWRANPDLTAPQSNCLDEQRVDVEIQLDRLLTADRAVLRAAPEVTAQIPDPSRCLDAEVVPVRNLALRLWLVPSLANSKADRLADYLEPANVQIERTLDIARQQKDPVLEIDALWERGKLRIQQGRQAEGITDLSGALALATKSEERQRAGLISVDRAWAADGMVEAVQRSEWLGEARGYISQLDQDPDIRIATLRLELARAIVTEQKNPLLAEQDIRNVIAGIEREGLERSPLCVYAHHALASCLYEQSDRRDEAAAAFDDALKAGNFVWGNDHVELAKVYSTRGGYLIRQREFGLARKDLLESLRLRENELPTPHPLLARSNIQLAQCELGAGDIERAKDYVAAATANMNDKLDQDWAAQLWLVKGKIALAEDEYQDAATYYQRSLEAAGPDQSFERAQAEVDYAWVLFRTGNCEDANVYFEKSLDEVEHKIVSLDPSQMLGTWIAHIQSLNACGEEKRAKRETERVSTYLTESQLEEFQKYFEP